MKGLTKAIMRTPHMMTSKVGMSKKSSDTEFDEYNRHFTILEGSAEQLMKDSKAFSEAVIALLTSGAQFAVHFNNVFTPLSNEHSLESSHPDAAATIKHSGLYQNEMDELKQALAPELELIESRVVGPVKELQGIMKQIRKNITKRDHKLVDYDRFTNSLTKLREKGEKSLSDEKNLFKLEQDQERATQEYEMFNTALKTDLPQFMVLATRFIDPLYHSFYYMQLNIYYLMLEKLQSFAEKKYHVGGSFHDIVNEYEERRGDSAEKIEALNITHRMVSTAKLMSNRSGSGSSSTALSRATSSNSGIGRSNTLAPSSKLGQKDTGGLLSPNEKFASLASKKGAPPPPPSASSLAAPPPYSKSPNTSTTSLTQKPSTSSIARSVSSATPISKKGPAPPPPLKPKPKPATVYVTALFDFEAQADGDLSFKVGDRIELIERSDSQEDWWTGRLNGAQGVFPGNYVQA